MDVSALFMWKVLGTQTVGNTAKHSHLVFVSFYFVFFNIE